MLSQKHDWTIICYKMGNDFVQSRFTRFLVHTGFSLRVIWCRLWKIPGDYKNKHVLLRLFMLVGTGQLWLSCVRPPHILKGQLGLRWSFCLSHREEEKETWESPGCLLELLLQGSHHIWPLGLCENCHRSSEAEVWNLLKGKACLSCNTRHMHEHPYLLGGVQIHTGPCQVKSIERMNSGWGAGGGSAIKSPGCCSSIPNIHMVASNWLTLAPGD